MMSRLHKATAWFCAMLFFAIVQPAMVAYTGGSLAWAMAVSTWLVFTAGVAFSDMCDVLTALPDDMPATVDAEEAEWRKLLEPKRDEYGLGRVR